MNKSEIITSETWQGKRVYVAPDNPAGRALAAELEGVGVTVLGRADNLKKGEGVINSAEDADVHDALVIAGGNYQREIAEGLVARGFAAETLRLVCHSQPLTVMPVRPKRLFTTLARIPGKLSRWLWSMLPATLVVYYAEQFVDTNVLVAFDAHRRRRKGVKLVVKDAKKLVDRKQVSHPLLVRYLLQRAKVIVIDHEFSDPVFNDIRTRTNVVQLWHGLPFKHLAGNKHFPHVHDNAFISSSQWFNTHIFPEIFTADDYLALGYPRNDALLQSREDRCWHNVVQPEIMDRFIGNNKLIIYMPTYRDDGNNDYPIDWTTLDAHLQQVGAVCLVKTHPFLSPAEQLTVMDGCTRVAMYPGRQNIYPWLAEAALLITDYSSVALDFLLTDKPVIHYCFDMARYESVRGKFLVPANEFMVGAMVESQDALFQEITLALSDDAYQQHRAKLRERYGITSHLACPQIIDYIDAKIEV